MHIHKPKGVDLNEWDEATKKQHKKLPEHVPNKKK